MTTSGGLKRNAQIMKIEARRGVARGCIARVIICDYAFSSILPTVCI